MARLIVEAVSGEHKTTDVVWELMLFVSVSRADDGRPVTGLDQENFRICSPVGSVLELKLLGGTEAQWEPTDQSPAGCYSLGIMRKWQSGDSPIFEWVKGEFYPFGIQVLVRDHQAAVIHMGQTVLQIESLGN